MDFKEYFHRPEKVTFTYRGMTVLIEEERLDEALSGQQIPLAYLQHYYGKPGEKRFKVTFIAPKDKLSATIGHYEAQTMYIVADNANQAKEKVWLWFADRINQRTKNQRYNVYKKNLNIQAKQVTTWNDLLELINFVANQRMMKNRKLTYFGKNEYDILSKQAHRKNFITTLTAQTPKTQQLIKTLLKNLPTDQNIKYVIAFLSQPIKKQQELSFEPEKKPYQGYWSIFQPKTQAEKEELLSQDHTRAGVIRLANYFGISKAQLLRHYNAMKESEEGMKWREEDDADKLWYQINKVIQNAINKKIKNAAPMDRDAIKAKYKNPTELDHASLPIPWIRVIQNVGDGSYIDHPLVHQAQMISNQQGYEFAGSYDLWEDWWSFYKEGPPEVTPLSTRWKETLQDMLHQDEHRRKDYENPKPEPEWEFPWERTGTDDYMDDNF